MNYILKKYIYKYVEEAHPLKPLPSNVCKVSFGFFVLVSQ